MSIGIEFIDLYTSKKYIELNKLAEHLNIDPDKYKYGIGQDIMSYCGDNEDIISMYLTLVEGIMKHYDYSSIGYLQIGTETLIDKSKSIKTHIMSLFNKHGNHQIYGLDTYNACYGGTAALFHATNWLESSMWTEDKPYALVLCGDIAVYKNDNELCTGGCGVIGMVVSRNGKLVIDHKSITMDFRNEWDFYKANKSNEYPIVNGKHSIKCYLDGLFNCYEEYIKKDNNIFNIDHIIFHHPYNKLVKKGLSELIKYHLGSESKDKFDELYNQKMEESTRLLKIIGNTYTASLYIGLLSLIYHNNNLQDKNIMLYSYGSGYTASIYNIKINSCHNLIDRSHIKHVMENRISTTAEEYFSSIANREHTYDLLNAIPIDRNNHVDPSTYILEKIVNGIRYYIQSTNYTEHDDNLINQIYKRRRTIGINTLSYKDYNYENVVNRCCENVIGYVKIPTGYVGPLLVNSKQYCIPMSTVEGALIASTNRGCKAIRLSGGAISICNTKGMTRAPLLEFNDILHANNFCKFIQQENTLTHINTLIKKISTHSTLINIDPKQVGNKVYLRIISDTSDAMGMNMLTKSSNAIIEWLLENDPTIKCTSLSSNYCTDKKNSAVNWINGRGRHVITEIVIKEDIINSVLKTTSDKLINVNVNKNFIGSNIAGTIGGMNAHIANMIAAIFLASGQDIAQVITSSMGITNIEKHQNGIRASVTLPSLECGIIGGGTHLESQKNVLDIIGVKSGDEFANVIGGVVLAGELSLIASLSVNTLVASHNKLNKYKSS